jgi:hypothetical protein
MSDDRTPSTKRGIQFVLVLMAVIMALGFVQVTGDRADERTALQMILADLETDSAELTAQLNRGHTTETAVMWVLRNIDRELPVDSVIAGISPLFYYTAYEQVQAGYLNLLYAGRLTVIRDPDLRQGVVDYFEQTHPYMWQFHAMYMDIYKEFKETTAPYIRFVPEPEGEVFVQSFHTEMVRPWEEMKADTDFRYKLEEIGAAGSQFGIRLGPALERNAELRAAIRQELGT